MSKRATAPLASVVVAVFLILSILTACGSSSSSSGPSASPSASSPAASKASSSPSASTSASPATSPAASKPAAGASDQEYQKALADFKQVEEAARKEGEATIYTIVDAGTLQKIQDAFNKLDPNMQVKIIRIPGAAAIERIRAEQSTKQIVGSAYWGTLPEMITDGLLQPFDIPVLHDPTVKWLADPLLEKPNPIVTTSLNKILPIYNTQLVPAGQEPKGWKDYADPKWKDKVMLWDPRTPSFTIDLLGLLYYNPDFGPAYVKAVAENTRASQDSTEGARAIARGEAALGLSSPATFATLEGAPIKTFTPAEGAFIGPTYMQMIKNTQQPNVTRVFANWLLSKEGQTVLSQGYATIRGDVQGANSVAQINPGEKLLPQTPYTYATAAKSRGEPMKAVTDWMNAAGR